MIYGIKIYDTDGNYTLLTPKLAKIVAGGVNTMPVALEGDNTYGSDISLSPFTNVPRADIGVIVQPTKVNWKATVASWKTGTSYPFSWYARSDVTYYTKNPANGVMTTWAAGAMEVADSDTWDPMCNCFPIAGWDFLDAETTFNSIRLWAAMAHIVYDYSASVYRTVYTISTAGVSEVNYMIFLKNR